MKAFGAFKNMQQKCMNVFWYVLVYMFWKFIQYIIHWDNQISCGVFTFWVSNQKNNCDIGQKSYWISLFFFALNYKHWKSQSFVNVFC